jgi:hypothetical protein
MRCKVCGRMIKTSNSLKREMGETCARKLTGKQQLRLPLRDKKGKIVKIT